MRPVIALGLVLVAPDAQAIVEDCHLAFPRGQESAGVRDVQGALKAQGFADIAVDGLLGRKTCNAVKAFQARSGAAVDGLLDPALLDRLRRPISGADAVMVARS